MPGDKKKKSTFSDPMIIKAINFIVVWGFYLKTEKNYWCKASNLLLGYRTDCFLVKHPCKHLSNCFLNRYSSVLQVIKLIFFDKMKTPGEAPWKVRACDLGFRLCMGMCVRIQDDCAKGADALYLGGRAGKLTVKTLERKVRKKVCSSHWSRQLVRWEEY